jgi:hypothetical protein
MVFDTTIAGGVEMCALTQMQGHAFVMELSRLNTLEGKVGMREGLTQRIIGESGGGQARAFLPGTLGGVPTALPAGASTIKTS